MSGHFCTLFSRIEISDALISDLALRDSGEWNYS